MSTSTNINALLSAVPKLTGSGNHGNWKFAVSMVLRRGGLWPEIQAWIDARMAGDTVGAESEAEADTSTSATTTTRKAAKAAEADAKKSEEILTIIGLTIDPSQYQHIESCTGGVEAWAKIAEIYEKDSRPSRIALKREFYTYTHDTTKPIQDYISGIGRLASALRAIGVKLDARDEVDVLIYCLSPDWGSLASTLTAQSAELTVTDVAGTLLDEEKRRGGPDPGSATAMKFPLTCYRCHQPGHIARNCPTKGHSHAHIAAEF